MGQLPRIAQALFLGGFTAVFYALGWYVRRKMKLEGSGLALTAVASALIPLDLYTYYASGGFPAESWPTVWLAGSILCLIAYTITVYAMRSEILGYLIPLAAGSTALALGNWLNLPVHWWPLTFTPSPSCWHCSATSSTSQPLIYSNGRSSTWPMPSPCPS